MNASSRHTPHRRLCTSVQGRFSMSKMKNGGSEIGEIGISGEAISGTEFGKGTGCNESKRWLFGGKWLSCQLVRGTSCGAGTATGL